MLKKTYHQAENVVFRKIAGESILVPVQGRLADMQRIYSLDTVSEFIWTRLNGKREIDEIVNHITEHFEIDRKEAEKDTIEFIKDLEKQGLAIQGV